MALKGDGKSDFVFPDKQQLMEVLGNEVVTQENIVQIIIDKLDSSKFRKALMEEILKEQEIVVGSDAFQKRINESIKKYFRGQWWDYFTNFKQVITIVMTVAIDAMVRYFWHLM